MGVVVACGVLMAAGAIAIWRWGHLAVQAPWRPTDAGTTPQNFRESLRRLLWYVDLVVIAGFASGLAGAGAGGRLVMRLLAATSEESAQGRLTEAEEVVGEITVGGTIGFMVFTGLFGGLMISALYFLIRRWLPPGRVGGLVFGLLITVLFATRLEPLRPDNEDFRIVGPAWLAVIAFLALALFHALVLTAVASRLSRSLPLIAPVPKALLPYAPLLLLIPVGALFVIPGVILVLLTWVTSRTPDFPAVWRDRRVEVAGRFVLAAVAVAALPGFVSDLADILG